MSEQVVIAIGVHVLDVLVRPVTEIPAGQGGALVEEIRMTAAGPAGGTALVLSRLGAKVRSAGAIGTDALGDALLAALQRDGVDTTHLLRRENVQTSASVLPIRPDGSRPALHCIGANATYGADEVTDALLDGATHLHLGGPEFLGGSAAASVLERAKARGITTSADVLAPGEIGVLDWIAEALAHIDFFLPNDEQVLGFTGASDLEQGCRLLTDRGVGCVAATRGGDGVLVVGGDGRVDAIPANDVEVVDTTGCGDAFSAGFLRGLALGRDRADAARLGCAVAGVVAGGLGSDHGAYDLATFDS